MGLLPVDAARLLDVTKEMAVNDGVDRDLELKLENLTFLETQKNLETARKADETNTNAPKGKTMDKKLTGKNSNSVQNVTPSKSTNTDSSLSTPAKSPRGIW